MLFEPGQIVATPGALDLASEYLVNIAELLIRHLRGDWGDIDEYDQRENALAVFEGYRIISAYPTMGGRLWIITEADRSVTTFCSLTSINISLHKPIPLNGPRFHWGCLVFVLLYLLLNNGPICI